MEVKSILVSRTFWTQVVAGLVLILPLLTGKGQLFDEETQSAIIGGLWAVANVILRLMTSEPVKVP